ncbi:MAG: glycosyltransferase [bacterium]
MSILVLSSQASNTGSTLRAEYIYKYLKKLDKKTQYIKPIFKSMPFMLDFIFSFIYNFFKLMNNHYDYVIIVKPYPNTVIPALMLKNRGAKIIIDIDDMDYGYRKGFLSKIVRWSQNKMINFANVLTTHNVKLQQLIVSEHPEYENNIYLLKQCVDMEIFNTKNINKEKVKVIRSSFENKKLLLYMAHLNIASYLEDILESFKAVHDSAVLLVAGGGPLLHHYVSIVKQLGLTKRVIFLGQLKQEVLAEYIGAAELCLVYYKNIPVNSYRASMKLREYLAMGKNVVANAVGELKDFKKYVILSSSDKRNFSSKINKHLNLKDKTNKKGHIFIAATYDWEKEIKAFYKFINGGLNK